MNMKRLHCRESVMIILNEAMLLGIAAVITRLSGLIWSLRRRK
jgi:hypothetical protein